MDCAEEGLENDTISVCRYLGSNVW